MGAVPVLGGIWEIAFRRGDRVGSAARREPAGADAPGCPADAARNGASWLASAWRMLEDMVLQRARVIAVLEAAGHASRGDHLPVYSGRGAELRSGIAAALRAGGLEAHEPGNRIYLPPEA
jgi:hypothetical protein